MAKPANKKKNGRPSSFKPEFSKVAYSMALLGATDKQIADACGVAESTFHLWKKQYPEFSESLKDGKEHSDEMVAQMLYKRATGYDHKAVKIFNNNGIPLIVPYIEHHAPDVTAQIFWLKNRRPAEWRDRQDVKIDASEDLAVRVAQMIAKGGKK